MKTLIAYYSHGGNNELLAYRLQKELACDILEVEPVGKRTGFSIFLDIAFSRTPRIKSCPVSLSSYDLLIFIGPVWAGKVPGPLKSFMVRERSHIENYAFISLCGGGLKEQAAKLRNELASIIGHDPELVKELWVVDLPLRDLKASPKMISGYRVTPEDVNHFVPDIRAFVEEVTADAVAGR
jgi:hypothetical protein